MVRQNVPSVLVKVSQQDFDAGSELKRLHARDVKTGAACSFIGYVREFAGGADGQQMVLEHYPGMTEKALYKIAEDACKQWALTGVSIIHRVGSLQPADQIVMVICNSGHRKDAFAACEFIMDFLKVSAPFWKKEITAQGGHWVEQKLTDKQKAANWKSSKI